MLVPEDLRENVVRQKSISVLQNRAWVMDSALIDCLVSFNFVISEP